MSAHTSIPINQVMRSRLLLGDYFAGPSWDRWEACLKAADGIKLNATELAMFTEVAGRSPPTRPVREFIAAAGRGAGKDSIISLDVTAAAISFDPRGRVRPGESVFCMCLAVDRSQSGILFGFIKGYFDEVPALKKMVRDITGDTITLSNRVIIEVTTNTHRGVRGRSILRAVLDEAAHYRSENSSNPDFELHGALTPGLARVKGSRMVLISSTHKRSGLLYQRFKDFYGRDDDDVLVVKGGTTAFNPTFDQREIDRALADDPQLYGAEYLSEWRDDLSSFIDRELVAQAVDTGVVVRPPQQGIRYTSFCDTSGGRGDSFTAAISHAEGQTAVLDCLIEIKSPFDPSIATRDVCTVLRSYGITRTVADHYSANWAVGAFARNGVKLENSDRNRSEIYLDALPLFASGRVRLIDNARMAAQIYNLERRTFPSGQDKVNHAPGGRDDAANSCCGALVLAAVRKFSSSMITADIVQRAAALRSPTSTYQGRARLTPLSPRPGSRNPMKVFF